MSGLGKRGNGLGMGGMGLGKGGARRHKRTLNDEIQETIKPKAMKMNKKRDKNKTEEIEENLEEVPLLREANKEKETINVVSKIEGLEKAPSKVLEFLVVEQQKRIFSMEKEMEKMRAVLESAHQIISNHDQYSFCSFCECYIYANDYNNYCCRVCQEYHCEPCMPKGYCCECGDSVGEKCLEKRGGKCSICNPEQDLLESEQKVEDD